MFGSKLLETVGMPGKVGIVAKSGIMTKLWLSTGVSDLVVHPSA